MIQKFGLVIQGGAGVITRASMTQEMEIQYRKTLHDSLLAGYKILENNGTALKAVEEAVKVMEDSPLFNAGKGSVFTNNETNQMDASIMDGSNLAAGSIGGVTRIKNPISAARLILEKTPHVLLIGPYAENFAERQGQEMMELDYFKTEHRYQQLLKAKEKQIAQLDHQFQQEKELQKNQHQQKIEEIIQEKNNKFGTVGAVALDVFGNLAAATSTGGMTNKIEGRVGDSAIIGAGTYANNKTCAISTTGCGEHFQKTVGAYTVSALMEFKQISLQEAADYFIHKKFKEDINGDGGLIGIDQQCNIVMPFNSEGMFRGFLTSDMLDQQPKINIYKD